jgi:ribosome-associated protein
MDNKYLKTAIDLIEDKSVAILEVLDVIYMTTYADYFIIAIAKNERQIAGVMDNFKEFVPTNEKDNVRVEGKPSDGWVIIQYYDVAVHLFLQPVHEQYRLDTLYEDAKRLTY